MITTEQIQGIGYNLITKLINDSCDFTTEIASLPKRINLNKGSIQTIPPLNSKEISRTFYDIESFKEFYNL